jgi:hypothetical protein
VIAHLAVLALFAPPSATERFGADGWPHVLLVVDEQGGQLVRADDAGAAEEERFPAGDAIRPIVALAALEEGAVDPEETVDCDSTCWGLGRHGSPMLLDALAVSCDSWFREAESRVPREALSERARALGFDTRSGGPPTTWGVTARAWINLWSRLADGSLGERALSAPTLLAAAGTAVTSPKGSAHSLYDPTATTRAFAGAGPAGAWVAGTFRADERHSWIFALFVRGGTAPLATARARALLEETLRVYRTSTAERGGEPLPPLDER